MEKNILIVNYNTQKLTDACIKSINKFMPGCSIFLLDNSDKEAFINVHNNVSVFDNTKGQIIDFDKWLEKYPNRNKSNGKTNKWGSAKHAYSIEKCMELINEPFLLFDSDTLLKKDASSLFDESFCYIGEIHEQDKRTKIKRVLPYICFINTTLCKKNGIHYFDENYMHGLRLTIKSDSYDTGAAIFLLAEKANVSHKEIKWSDYVVHYAAGSWTKAADKMRKKTHIPVDEWLETYRYLWDESVEKEIPDAGQKISPSYVPEDGPANNNERKPAEIVKWEPMEKPVKQPIVIRKSIVGRDLAYSEIRNKTPHKNANFMVNAKQEQKTEEKKNIEPQKRIITPEKEPEKTIIHENKKYLQLRENHLPIRKIKKTRYRK